jgi:hypothetical protein
VAQSRLSREEFYVHDPTPYLDSLLYEVMRTKNPQLAIPWEAIEVPGQWGLVARNQRCQGLPVACPRGYQQLFVAQAVHRGLSSCGAGSAHPLADAFASLTRASGSKGSFASACRS